MTISPSQERLRVVQVVAHHHRRIAFEWIAQHHDRERLDLSFILMGEQPPLWAPALDALDVPHRFVPLSDERDADAVATLAGCFRELRPEVVHAHYRATFPALLAAFLERVPGRVHTRRSGARPPGRPQPVHLAAIQAMNHRLSTRIVAISEVVRSVLEGEGVERDAIDLVHHGFDLEAFSRPDPGEVARLRRRFVPEAAGPVVGVVSRAVDWKGYQHLVPAFARLLRSHPNAVLLLADLQGHYLAEVHELLATLPQGRVVITPYVDSMNALYSLFDVFVHVPTGPGFEAFGMVYIEALAAGVPSVVTLSGIAHELLEHRRNAWVVPHGDVEALAKGLETVLADSELAWTMARQGRLDVDRRFGIETMVSGLEAVYRRAAGRLSSDSE